MATHTAICLGYTRHSQQTALFFGLIFSSSLLISHLYYYWGSWGIIVCSLKLNTDVGAKNLTQEDKTTNLSCFCKNIDLLA